MDWQDYAHSRFPRVPREGTTRIKYVTDHRPRPRGQVSAQNTTLNSGSEVLLRTLPCIDIIYTGKLHVSGDLAKLVCASIWDYIAARPRMPGVLRGPGRENRPGYPLATGVHSRRAWSYVMPMTFLTVNGEKLENTKYKSGEARLGKTWRRPAVQPIGGILTRLWVRFITAAISPITDYTPAGYRAVPINLLCHLCSFPINCPTQLHCMADACSKSSLGGPNLGDHLLS